jgi:SRSO17 transposase
VAYLVQMPEDTLCRLKHPGTVVKTYKYRGRERTKKILASSREPISIKMLAAGINNFFWYRRKISEGAKGPIEYEFTKKRIVLAHGGLPQKTVWLLIRENHGQGTALRLFYCECPGKHQAGTFVWLSGLRWSIEQCFAETKTELGMDQYEVRNFPGWHHHILTSMLAHYFLWHLKIRLGEKSTSYYAVAAQMAAESGVAAAGV